MVFVHSWAGFCHRLARVATGVAGLVLIAAGSLACAETAAVGAAGDTPPQFIAGLAPYERPQGAPVLREPLPELVRADQALQGISDPVPPSIHGFLKYQGAWYTPFSRPGMMAPYDMRGWHARASAKSSGTAGK